MRSQLLRDIEIIVVDDGSTDGTAAWLRANESAFPGLRVIEGRGAGVSAARNKGIEAARAPLIAFLDADDWWWPGKLLAQIGHHTAHPTVGFSFSDYLHCSEAGESRGTCFEYWNFKLRTMPYHALQDPEATLLGVNLVGTSTVVARKALLERCGGFRDGISAEDWSVWLKLAASGPVAVTGAITATYLMRRNSLTANREARISAIGEIISHYDHATGAPMRRALAKARARVHIARAELAEEQGQHTAAMRHHSRALMAFPSARAGKAAASNLLAAARNVFFKSGGRA